VGAKSGDEAEEGSRGGNMRVCSGRSRGNWAWEARRSRDLGENGIRKSGRANRFDFTVAARVILTNNKGNKKWTNKKPYFLY
jgi:hypothetical protein